MTSPVLAVTRPAACRARCWGSRASCARLGVDVRILAPCDGPPPAPGVVCVGPSVEWSSNGSIAPIATGADAAPPRRGSVAHDRTATSCTCTSRRFPGPCLSTLLGFDGPMVGTFHASGELLHQWSAAGDARRHGAPDVRVVVSESARETAVRELGRRLRRLVERHRDRPLRVRGPTPSDSPAVLFVGRHEPRKGLGGAARRVAATSTATPVLWVAVDRARRRRSCASATSHGRRVARRHLGPRARAAHARGDGVLRAVAATASRSASCCSRRWPRARRSSRRRSRVTRTSPAPTARRCSSRRATSARLRDALRRVLDDADAARAARRGRAARAPPSSRWRGSPSATSSSTSRRSSPRRRRDEPTLDRRSRSTPRRRSATRSRRRSAIRRARERVGVAPGGDATMAIDEIAEAVVEQCLAAAGDIGFYSEDRGLRGVRPTRARSSSSTRSTAPGPRRPASSRAACRSRSCRRAGRDARRRDVRRRARDQERRRASSRARGGGAHRAADGSPIPLALLGEHRSRRAVLDRRAAGPARRCR